MASHERSVARDIDTWFRELLELCDRTLFGVSDEPRFRALTIWGVLTRNARIITTSKIDDDGSLYQPIVLTLASTCRRINVEPTWPNWLAALGNLFRLRRELAGSDPTRLGLEMLNPTSIFADLFESALVQAGVTDEATLLDEQNRDVALGTAVNWGMRFLLAYAVACHPEPESIPTSAHDLRWLAGLVHRVGAAAG